MVHAALKIYPVQFYVMRFRVYAALLLFNFVSLQVAVLGALQLMWLMQFCSQCGHAITWFMQFMRLYDLMVKKMQKPPKTAMRFYAVQF